MIYCINSSPVREANRFVSCDLKMKTMRDTMNRTPIVIPMIAPVESFDLLLLLVLMHLQ